MCMNVGQQLWDRIESIREGHWCDCVTRAILSGCDNATVFNYMGLGQQALTSPIKLLAERTAYFAAFDHVRDVNRLVVKQQTVIGTNGQQPIIQMR